jgi:hypothetical protein
VSVGIVSVVVIEGIMSGVVVLTVVVVFFFFFDVIESVKVKVVTGEEVVGDDVSGKVGKEEVGKLMSKVVKEEVGNMGKVMLVVTLLMFIIYQAKSLVFIITKI